jgi:hypothetical protein
MRLKIFSAEPIRVKAIKVNPVPVRAPVAAEKEKPKRKRKKEPVILSRKISAPSSKNVIRESEKKLQTRKLDMTKMMSVKIDHKTSILVPIGSDPEEVKRKYERRTSVNPPVNHLPFHKQIPKR